MNNCVTKINYLIIVIVIIDENYGNKYCALISVVNITPRKINAVIKLTFSIFNHLLYAKKEYLSCFNQVKTRKLRTALALFRRRASLNCTLTMPDDIYYSAHFTKYAKAS